MPARKNRPGKFGVDPAHVPAKVEQDHAKAIKFFTEYEREFPGAYHYTPWDLVTSADELVRKDLLLESPTSRGSYKVTHKFWMAYISPTR